MDSCKEIKVDKQIVGQIERQIDSCKDIKVDRQRQIIAQVTNMQEM